MNDKAKTIAQIINSHCDKKGYQIQVTECDNKLRYQVSNGLERVPADLYFTGSFVPGGSPKLALRKEFDELKEAIEKDPQILLQELKQRKSIAVKYDILEKDRIDNILDDFKQNELIVEDDSELQQSQIFRKRIIEESKTVVVTYFNSGTLLIQGKENKLTEVICTIVEKVLLPKEKDLAVRFLSGDEKNVEKFVSIYSPQILDEAEKNVKDKLEKSYTFLEEYDKKYMVASECLLIAKIELPEYSALVMPAAKAFEGFAKKLVVKIGLLPTAHFKSKSANFGILKDKTQPARRTLVDKEKYADTFLDKLSNALDMSRNFMMHSDDSQVTKVDTYEDAVDKQRVICESIEEIFKYFNKPEFGGLV